MALNPRIGDWHGLVVWVIGASSGIGRATADALHSRGASVVVSARKAEALADFERTHPGSLGLPLDVNDLATCRQTRDQLMRRHGKLDLVLYCAGHYQAQRASAYDLRQMELHMRINYGGALNMLEVCLPLLRTQGFGHISLVASVAGYRGLPNALAYGPTKAALQHLAEVLYLDLRASGIAVSVINPGFVATPLTSNNAFPMPALLTPEAAARNILQGWAAGRFEIHFPKRFTLWLKLLHLLPFGLYAALLRRGAAL